MLRHLLLLSCFLGGLSAAVGQQLPFQGRLLESNLPVTGTRSFVFAINDGGITWTETHNGVTVTNGLYALVLGQNNPLPTSLFNSQNNHSLSIQVNGQAIGTVTLYAPLETDPTVDPSVKDGVDWSEIQNIPSLDLSPTNELQQLSLDGDQLTISNGNTVTLPGSGAGDTFTVGNIETVTSTAIDQSASDGNSIRNFLWQSFSLLEDATLKSVELQFANSTAVDIRFRLYPGEGTSGQSLWTNDFPAANYGATLELQAFPVSDPNGIALEAGQVYTFQVSGIGDDLLFRTSSTNPYPVGITNINSTTDGVFRLIVENEDGYTLAVNPDQITMDAPLTVNDRIKDKTGFVMPVGLLAPFAGATPPEGWLLCDGSAVSRILYADLFAAIGTSWGTGDGTTTFNLPDMRGRFPRGVDQGAGNDPEAAQRSASNGGNSGDNVGSYQNDEIKSHDHFMANEDDVLSGGVPDNDNYLAMERNFGASNYNYNLRASNTEPFILRTGLYTGAESRPKNANVNFIIKF